MRFGSVCSGIEAASVAWLPLGAECAFTAEVDPHCCALLEQWYPDTPNLGDINAEDFIEKARGRGSIDVLVGGTPCQAFSVAGLRGGLADARGNLTLRFLAVADTLRPRWILWENVPGVLSATSHVAPDPRKPGDDLEDDSGLADGYEVVVEDEYDADEDHAFSCFLAGLSELGYGFGFASLDAQYFGLAQRRERVFVVGYLGAWQPAAAVLLDSESMSGHPAPSRETGQRVAGALASRSTAGGGLGTDFDLGGGLQVESASDGDREGD